MVYQKIEFILNDIMVSSSILENRPNSFPSDPIELKCLRKCFIAAVLAFPYMPT